MNPNEVHIGTSGWVYKDWQPTIYPKELKGQEWLSYYATIFKTTEINNSFYHLPEAATFDSWRKKTPADFVFSVKLSRYITHIKRLKSVKKEWNIFLKRAVRLKDKCGPILIQFPPSFIFDEERFERLNVFVEYAAQSSQLAFEFRDSSWFKPSVFKILKQFNAALVSADSANYPKSDILSTDLIYIRMHGPKGLFSSKYSINDLKKLSEKIISLKKSGKRIFVYFNNDFHGFAVENAKTLISLL